jgi:hypothetical protein
MDAFRVAADQPPNPGSRSSTCLPSWLPSSQPSCARGSWASWKPYLPGKLAWAKATLPLKNPLQKADARLLGQLLKPGSSTPCRAAVAAALRDLRSWLKQDSKPLQSHRKAVEGRNLDWPAQGTPQAE